MMNIDSKLNEYGFECINSELIVVLNDIDFTFYDYDTDDFDCAGILAGYYEIKSYSINGYICRQLVIDESEIDIPSNCRILPYYDTEMNRNILQLVQD